MTCLRILFVSHRFPPNFSGGADLYTYQLGAELQRRGHDVWVICAEELHDAEVGRNEVRPVDEPYGGLPVRRLHFNFARTQDPYGWLYVWNPMVHRAMSAYVDEVAPDVVHITACDYLSNAVVSGAKAAGIPVVLTLTGKWHICPVATLLRWDGTLCAGRQDGMTCLRCMFGRTRVYRALQVLPLPLRSLVVVAIGHWPATLREIRSLNFIRAVQRRNRLTPEVLAAVDHIISPSVCHRTVFSAAGVVAADRIEVSPHGINGQLARRGRRKEPASRVRFGFTGQVLPHKGVDTLVAAFALMPADVHAELHIHGDMDLDLIYSASLRSLAAARPEIAFHGRFDNCSIGTVLSEIDVLVVPSRCVENMPVTILEAFAAGTPVIGSDTCGVNEMIEHGRNGLLFRRGDASDLAAQMQRLLDEPGLLETIRARVLPPRTISDEAEHLEGIYEDLAARGSHRPVTGDGH